PYSACSSCMSRTACRAWSHAWPYSLHSASHSASDQEEDAADAAASAASAMPSADSLVGLAPGLSSGSADTASAAGTLFRSTCGSRMVASAGSPESRKLATGEEGVAPAPAGTSAAPGSAALSRGASCGDCSAQRAS